ncbi:MAG: M48 family metalloprotease [Deltaproteobacteria bacterium]|nr:M48 family metalloprotease [Deltaproteobacteria bacterium]
MGAGVKVAVPSLRWRAFVVLLLLVGFYLGTFVLSATLFAAPCMLVYGTGFHGLQTVVAFVAGWAPAFVLFFAVLGARPPAFSPDGIELFLSHNRALHALVDEVAKEAGTAPPTEIYLMGTPMAGVVEVGGLFARRPKRVLLLGAPLLTGITVRQLRAILAHEMGHFIGGETRLSGVISYAQHTFAAVYEASVKRGEGSSSAYGSIATEATHFIGTGYVRLYMRLFLALTRPTSRKQEIAADALSVRLAGREAAIGALERSHCIAALHHAYLENEVRPALRAGAAPIELLDGFERFCAKIRERGLEAKLSELVREEKTDPFDSHPAYTDRVEMMKTFEEGPRGEVAGGERRAIELIELDPEKLREWLVDLLLDAHGHGRAVPRLAWATIAEKKLPAQIKKDAKEVVELLSPHFPGVKGVRQTFLAAVGSLADGSFVRIAHALAPVIAHLGNAHRVGVVQSLGAALLTPLFEASLLARGASVEVSLGEPSRALVLDGERVLAGDLAAKAMSDGAAAAEVTRWAEKLAA